MIHGNQYLNLNFTINSSVSAVGPSFLAQSCLLFFYQYISRPSLPYRRTLLLLPRSSPGRHVLVRTVVMPSGPVRRASLWW